MIARSAFELLYMLERRCAREKVEKSCRLHAILESLLSPGSADTCHKVDTESVCWLHETEI